MDEFNMIWACYMYGWFHVLNMMSWIWIWYEIWKDSWI